MRPSVLNHLLIALLTAVALLATWGCDGSILLEDRGSRRATEWLTGNNYVFRCISGSLQVFVIYPSGALAPIQSSINGEDCTESEYDNGRANTISEVAGAPVGFSPQSAKSRDASADDRSATRNLFGSMPPLPFAPAFPIDDMRDIGRNCAPGGAAYVVNHQSSRVTKINVCPVSLGTRIPVGSNPLQAALTPDGRTLLVTRFDGAVVFVDTQTDRVTTTLTASQLGFPNGIAISPDGTRAYVSNYDDSDAKVVVIDIPSRTIVGSVVTPVLPKSVFLTPDGQQLWILHFQTTSVTVVDTLSLTVVATVNLGSQAEMGMAFNPTGTRAYVGIGANRLVVLDTATLDEVTRIPLPFLPSDVAVTPDGSRVVVNSWSNGSAAVVDAATNQVLQTTASPGAHSMGLVLFR